MKKCLTVILLLFIGNTFLAAQEVEKTVSDTTKTEKKDKTKNLPLEAGRTVHLKTKRETVYW